MKQMYEEKKLAIVSYIWITIFIQKSSFVSTGSKPAVIQNKRKVAPKKWRLLVDPPDYIIFSAKLIWYKKSQLSIKKGGGGL